MNPAAALTRACRATVAAVESGGELGQVVGVLLDQASVVAAELIINETENERQAA